MTWTIPAIGRHTSGYGPRNTGIPGASTFHRGYDIAPPRPGQRGVPVWAVGPGKVAAREYNKARGQFVRIRHDDGSMTLYQHLDRFDVALGQRVTAGQQIGLMGDTGVGAGVHLHFECYEAGRNAYVLANAVDPVAYLRHRGVDLRTGARLVDLDRPIGGTVPTAPDPTRPAPLEEDDMFTDADRATLNAVAQLATLTAQRTDRLETKARRRDLLFLYFTTPDGKPAVAQPTELRWAIAPSHGVRDKHKQVMGWLGLVVDGTSFKEWDDVRRSIGLAPNGDIVLDPELFGTQVPWGAYPGGDIHPATA